jgi:two-component system probable response regulator PhcQ
MIAKLIFNFSKPMQILFVDDEEKSRKYFSMIFGKAREVVVATDGSHGLEILANDHSQKIGVVVTDHIMPRMTGIEMLARASDNNPALVRVLSTAYTDSELIAGAVRDGLIDYCIGKPWSIGKLQDILDRAAEHYQINKQNCCAATVD